ncbi:MAG: endonuclease/exonuclease/phosphatase family protein [Salinibacter sp.]|uniref:endonuclease/exonuclease/phosphatase family protein n=1 Tax=Salinibacter sp. TaxID=2065818 RepID=UPI0035D44F18
MSYNIRYAPRDTGRRAWRNRREPIASLIRFHAPDVVGTQEGTLHQLIDLEERLRGTEWIGVGRRSGGDEFSALFYRTDRLALLEHDTFWLSKTPNTPGSKSWGAALPRIATWARFRDQASGNTPFVLNTRFDHEREKARIKSARLITESLGALSESAPVVVMGDINAFPESRPHSLFTRAGDDAPAIPPTRCQAGG